MFRVTVFIIELIIMINWKIVATGNGALLLL
jgi:hypothetical protein